MTTSLELNLMSPEQGHPPQTSFANNQPGEGYSPYSATQTLHSNSNSISNNSAEVAPPLAASRPRSPSLKKNVSNRKRLFNIRWRSPRVIHMILTATATISAISFSIALSWRYVVRNVDYEIPLLGDPLRKVSLVADYVALDLTAGSLTVDWYPLTYNCTSDPEAIINFYFDPNLLIATSNSASTTSTVRSDAPPTTPTFQFNTTSHCNPGIRDSFPTFRTSARLTGEQSEEPSGLTSGSLQAYPFDKYLAQFFIFAEVNGTNETVGIEVESPFGAPVNFNIELDNSRALNLPEGLLISLYATRSTAVKILAMLIVSANWIVTIAYMYITAACLVWQDERVVTELFALPIAALFAFTSVRASLPGAPTGFGAFIDFVGILPNLAVITLCSAVLLFLVLWRRIKAQNVPRDQEAANHVMGIWRRCSQELAQDDQAEKAAKSILAIWRHIQREIEQEREHSS